VKTIFLFVLIAPFMMAQPIFDKYQSNDQVTYVSISPRMFQMLANMNIDDSNPDAKEFFELVSSIETFKLLRTDDAAISNHLSQWTQTYVNANNLSELMQVQEDDSKVNFYALPSQDSLFVKELLMLVTEQESSIIDPSLSPQTVLLFIKGNIDLEKIASLTKELNLPASEDLKKLKSQLSI
jgi:hypothetical protein